MARELTDKKEAKGPGGRPTTYNKEVLELARDELKSLSRMYMDNVEFSNPAPNFWVVTLKEPAMWIEEGRKSGFMQELLDGKSSKVSKEGKKYAVIPFEHSKKPTEQSFKAQQLANQIKDVMKQKGLNWQKIEIFENWFEFRPDTPMIPWVTKIDCFPDK